MLKSRQTSITITNPHQHPTMINRLGLFLQASLLLAVFGVSNALQQTLHNKTPSLSRRSILFTPITFMPAAAFAAPASNGLVLATTPSGLKWADAKVGTGQVLKNGATASIDYTMASTGGRSPKIYSSKDLDSAPYRWKLGDGSTIVGIEKAILGDEGIPPMLPGGVRRLIVPSSLAYKALSVPNAKCSGNSVVGPIPPLDDGAFQRFKNLYCNPAIPYQPDLVVDIKLYGKRTNQ